jgi:hypothetical protein
LQRTARINPQKRKVKVWKCVIDTLRGIAQVLEMWVLRTFRI